MERVNIRSLISSRNPTAFHYNGYGDRLLALPAIRALASIFPGQLNLICGKDDHATYYSDLPLRRVYELEYQRGEGGWMFDAPAIAREIGTCDLFISFNPWHTESMKELLSLFRSANSIGFYSDFEYCVPFNHTRHMVDMMFEIPHLLNPRLSVENFAAPLSLPKKELSRAHQLRAKIPETLRLLTVHTETLPDKMWPTDRFVAVLDAFFDRHDDYVAFVLDKSGAGLDAGKHSERVIQLPYLPLVTAYALVSCSDLFLGIDSCFLHAADLFRVPGVGLFGPTKHGVFGFRFGPHRHVYANGPMKNIDEADVLEALQQMVLAAAPSNNSPSNNSPSNNSSSDVNLHL
jgi:hypothetical protein